VIDGKIAFFGKAQPSQLEQSKQIIDAEGGHVFPGGIDAHVHICQDTGAAVCADNFETGSRSAAAGGTTTIVTFACQNRQDTSTLKVLADYHAKANSTGSYVDYGFHMIITNPSESVVKDEIPVLMQEGISSCKLFMTYDAMKLKDNELLDIMLASRKEGMTTMMHAENGDIINWLTDRLEEKGMLEPVYHGWSRPPVVEAEATNRAITLSELIDQPILFVHVSAAEAANTIRKAQTRGVPIFAETCPQYLYLTWQDLQRFHDPACFENSKHVCSPPPGLDGTDQEAIWTGLANGTFTIFSSDHCPYLYKGPAGKILGVAEYQPERVPPDIDYEDFMRHKKGHFKHIPNGCPGVETRLALLYKGLEEGRLSPQRFVELTSTNPAKLYGLYPQKGCLLPGSDADFTIWHPRGKMRPFTLTNSVLHHNVDYTPYEGVHFENWPRYTILRGKVLWKEGELADDEQKTGHFVKRGPSQLHVAASRLKDKRRVAEWLY